MTTLIRTAQKSLGLGHRILVNFNRASLFRSVSYGSLAIHINLPVYFGTNTLPSIWLRAPCPVFIPLKSCLGYASYGKPVPRIRERK